MVQRSLRSWFHEQFDAAQVDFLNRRSAGTLCYVSHEEAARRLGLPVQ